MDLKQIAALLQCVRHTLHELELLTGIIIEVLEKAR